MLGFGFGDCSHVSYGVFIQMTNVERSDTKRHVAALLADAKEFATAYFPETSTDDYPDGFAVMAVLNLCHRQGRGTFKLGDVRAERARLLAARGAFYGA